MGVTERNIVLIGLGIVTIYDVVTTITGTIDILDNSGIAGIIVAILLSLILGGLLYYSYEIHNIKDNNFAYSVLKLIWFFALVYDLVTSFMGNNKFIIQAEFSLEEIGKILILIGLTVFVSSCPVILSYLRHSESFMLKDEA